MRWPHGKVAAASFTFDVDAETYLLATDPDSKNRPGLLSQALYDPKVGVPLILEALAKHDVKATFFVPGLTAELHPDSVSAIVQGGHELAVHGYTHTPPHLLSLEQESEQLTKAVDILTAEAGEISGYRSPSWDVSPNTLGLLEENGLTYSSNFMDDLTPYQHDGRRIVELPIQWILDDYPHFGWSPGEDSGRIRNTREVEAIWTEEFDGIVAYGGSYILTMHPEVSGRPSRVALLERMMDYVAARDDVWVTTCAEIATHAMHELSAQER
jgi:peptidoglycan/xylan/chitin deacetylase (PgdA/CDA1 family)